MAKIIVALDHARGRAALDLVDALGAAVSWYKVGARLFTGEGPPLVRELDARGKSVFLDLKYLDIPNTVQGAVGAAADLGVALTTVHASGGVDMMRAAASAADGSATEVVAVTLLTSLTGSAAAEAWGREAAEPGDEVSRLAGHAAAAGMAGVVCGASEAARVRAERGPAFRIVTPGIRPAGAAAQDQRRVATPDEAVRAGADYLVVGRAVTAAADPVAAALAIADSLAVGVAT
ncbi:MAG: orotidine-5'-phosphate decarboxylase [Gemmatimonadota bacterium]